MIDKLTKEQEDAIPKVRDEWIQHGLSTEPANRKLVEEGVSEAYTAAGLKPPTRIEWVDGPEQAVDMIKKEMKVINSSKEEISQALYSIFYGQHDAGWLSYYAYFREHLPEVKGPERLDGLIKIAKNGGWVWMLADLAVCCERPAELHLFTPPDGGAMVLHKVDGPAFKWRSGKSLYFIRGISVKEELFTKPLSAAIINKEENSEVKRVLIENYGNAKYIKEMDAKVLDQTERGTIFRAEVPGDEALTMVRYINRTPEHGMTECNYCQASSKEDIEFAAAKLKAGGATALFTAPSLEAFKKARASQFERTTGKGKFCKCGAFVLVGPKTKQEVYKVYWHRVPPGVTKAKDAFAWMYQIQDLGDDWDVVDES